MPYKIGHRYYTSSKNITDIENMKKFRKLEEEFKQPIPLVQTVSRTILEKKDIPFPIPEEEIRKFIFGQRERLSNLYAIQ